jgi:hypothetical protein
LRHLLLSLSLVALAGCPGRDVEVVKRSPESNDHGYAALISLVEAHSAKPVSPVAFRQFVVDVAGVRPRFNEEVSDLAELYVAFFALPVFESVAGETRQAQLDAIALTVFPTAFELEPEAGESARDYLLRLCGDVQPLMCKDFVPEGWAVVLSAKARRRLKHRAEEALSQCTTCGDETVYTEILERFSKVVAREDAFAKEHEGDYVRGKWPMAGGHADAWSEVSLFARVDGVVSLDGQVLPPGAWHRPLKAARARGGQRVLGVHLEPDDSTGDLRAIGRDAARAGYELVAVQVRDAQFPYALREYRVALRGRARRVDVRDIDTIQILARALDAKRAHGDTPPRL